MNAPTDNSTVFNPAAGEQKRLCLEVNPPRGTEILSSFKRLETIVDKVDFFNVTDCALARMKMAALPFGGLLKKETGKEVAVNLACRDRNLIALQSDLLAAWATGVRSIVALTGDAVSVGDSPERKGVFEINSVGLLQTIAALNSGRDIDGHELKGRTDFICGSVCNPNAKNTEVEVRRLDKKKMAAAVFTLSQPVFDLEVGKKFFNLACTLKIDLYLGLMPLKNRKALESIKSVPGIKLGEEFLQRTAEMNDMQICEYSLKNAVDLASTLRDLVSGFHVISGGYPSLANDLISELHTRFISR